MQQKDIIYIDVEDDITAIIGKVKSANNKIVALVPPKRTGVLQSAVNLRLLARAADGADKRLVLITQNAALGSLAASADIPVAKNLQSRPELAKAPDADDEDEDVIDGDQLPVGDHDRLSKDSDSDDKVPASSISGLNIDGEPTSLKPKDEEKKPKLKKGISVPDFGSFRKKLAFGVGGGVLLLVLLFWAIWIAPHATIVVSAKTTGQSLSNPVTLGPDLVTNNEKTTIKSIKQQEKVSQSVEFDATGSKDVGDKATGTVTFSTNQITLLGSTIPTGTHLTASGGRVFVTTQSVTFTLSNYNGATTGIAASESGPDYNGAVGSVSGAPSGVSASITGATSGGTTKVVKIVSQEDVEKAKEQLAEQNKGDVIKKLKAKFDKNDILIESSFNPSGDEPKSDPAIGAESASGKAKLTNDITYTMVAIAKGEMNDYLDASFEKMLTNSDQQRIYDNGISSVNFEDFKAGDGVKVKTDTVNLTTTAQVGPKINDNDIKEQVKGKRSGEIIGDIKAIDGVSDVEVKLSPFWVGGVPGDVKKISVEFKLK